jgi:prepilin-type N-terminal cleavage/methylation domain-containing protein
MRRTRRAFTFVELLVVVSVIGIVAAIAIPKLRDLKRRALATQIVGDFEVVRHAAMTFLTDSGYFPAEENAGVISKSMEAYLPTGFSMAKPDWTMDYDHFELLGLQVIAVSFSTTDTKIGQTAMKLLGHSSAFAFGGKYTVVISGM